MYVTPLVGGVLAAEEVLDGDNAYSCERCKAKRRSVKRLAIYRCPKVLVRHF